MDDHILIMIHVPDSTIRFWKDFLDDLLELALVFILAGLCFGVVLLAAIDASVSPLVRHLERLQQDQDPELAVENRWMRVAVG